MTAELLRTDIVDEVGVLRARQLGRAVADQVGLDVQDQIRVATALSEVGRDLYAHASTVSVRFSLDRGVPAVPAALVVEVSYRDDAVGADSAGAGPLARAARSAGQAGSGGSAGPAEGIAAAYRLMDRVTTETVAGETMMRMRKHLPGSAMPVTDRAMAAMRERLADLAPSTVLDELRRQNQELILALENVQRQQGKLLGLNAELEETNRGVVALYTQLSAELEETNRGVVALYAELDDTSARLRELGESKNRFWAGISHELRTPLNSIIGLVRLLLDPAAEPLTGEQRHQIGLIEHSGRTLLDLVNELLDMAKIESGRLVPHPERVDLTALLAQLRAVMRPLTETTEVGLTVADATGPRELVTDEVMLSRILRNLLSNGLKFTRQGEVRLTVTTENDHVLFTVRDTGIGIPADQQSRVFEEFYQVPGAQRGGTGLGLPYARRLAELLGGDLLLDSRPGRGTTVTARLPLTVPDGDRPGSDRPGDDHEK